MLKKTFIFSSVLASLFILVMSVFVMAPPVSAQIATDKPNCFNPGGQSAYTPVECSQAIAFFYGKPMENGKCYVARAGTGINISVSEISCDLVVQKTEQGEADKTNAEEQVPAQTRDEVSGCDGTDGSGNIDQAKLQDCVKKNPLVTRFVDVINFLSIGVAVLVTVMVIIGGIQYTTAGSNPQAVSAAKKKILNAFIALVAYFLVYAFMQYLIPGGIF